MPFVSQAQRKWMFAKKPRMAAEWASKTPKGTKLPEHVKRKKKAKFIINNKLKSYGEMNTKTNVVEINKKKHKGDKAELADTIKHELLHVKHPKMREKTVYKKTGHISHLEQSKLVAKLRMKKINYRLGATKRKLGVKHKVEPGELITKYNSQKTARNKDRMAIPVKVGIMGMV